MVLTPGDFDGGAAVASEGSFSASPPAVATYRRSFRPGARLAGRRLIAVENRVVTFGEAETAAAEFDLVRRALATPSGRRLISDDYVEQFRGKPVRLKSINVGNPVSVRLGQEAFRVSIVLRTTAGRVEVAYTLVRVDQAIGVVELGAYPRAHLTTGPPILATARLAQHFNAAFTIRNTTPPSMVGTPQQGQTLTADSGRWSGAPSRFTYQWNRCDAAGANCAAIAGAVGQTYVVGVQDHAARLTVSVTAANSVSSSASTSAATPAVP